MVILISGNDVSNMQDEKPTWDGLTGRAAVSRSSFGPVCPPAHRLPIVLAAVVCFFHVAVLVPCFLGPVITAASRAS